ncbi:DUF6119 family protein [Neobacillus sp. PS3-34]|uniref:DUF6119 family protein n=1 Tax=Neobacillus sp. PS3-34 TaxID=3070678 RepID=UPI0027DF72A9|nr:DUF6119 family protein [Neobacillus sp. PS3-34]WML50171.1 DUF6119 family protein [Neobacillus sp. PS3-34]
MGGGLFCVCETICGRRFFGELSKDKHFSATLSHLLAQGSVSMLLLREYAEYKRYLVEQASQKFPDEGYTEDDFPYRECKLIYAFFSSKTEDIRVLLPFFSKVNLLHHTNLIKCLGKNVRLFKIHVHQEAEGE